MVYHLVLRYSICFDVFQWCRGVTSLDYQRRVRRIYRGVHMSNVYCEQRNCKSNHDGMCQSEWAIVIKPDENGKPVCADFEEKE